MTVSAEQAFGPRDARLGPLKVPAANAPAGMKTGDMAGLSNGMMARVLSVDAEAVTIDANHVYAGEDLDVTVTLLEAPNADSLETATVAGGCFWGLELAYQREPGVVKTAVGYAQGADPAPTYEAVCSGTTGHTEAVRVVYDPARVSFERLCDLLLDRLGENRYALNRVGNDQGTQYPAAAPKPSVSERSYFGRRLRGISTSWPRRRRDPLRKPPRNIHVAAATTRLRGRPPRNIHAVAADDLHGITRQPRRYRHGIYAHGEAQLATARDVIAREQQRDADRSIVTEVEPVAAYFDAEDYHQQYLQKKGQSARKRDETTIRCYG